MRGPLFHCKKMLQTQLYQRGDAGMFDVLPRFH
jgi:hypothetical protein